MIHLVSQRVENDVILYFNNSVNESPRPLMSRTQRFEQKMNLSYCSSEFKLNYGESYD